MKKKTANILYVIATLMVASGALGIMVLRQPWMAWITLLGSLLYTIAVTALTRRSDATTRWKRLSGMAALSGILWFVTAVLSLNRLNVWGIVAIFATLFMIYSNIRLTFLMEKEKKSPSKDSNAVLR